ncbi:hypothetical protein Ssi03_25520 [Sphaerisporangium siamense]|uniref:Uncharacterized protein n=1 Tax=Sphaerisporangium siamense TaxID=795645 RepID=A0A7W7D4J5_9ACTN|nr:hypothetical protein [Sphaerisporangium siamense]MBB4700123.1 hypothetical protein [Sphaerisporangium siamense]GII84562.1 hypothetical protein Ssi03_25520 [Sphaerisporangium siamense]
MTPAEELRAAAARLRERAEQATPGPWSVGNDDVIGLGIEQTGRGSFTYDAQIARVLEDYERDEENYGNRELGTTEGDARWMALVHPGLAEPLAAWLESWDDVNVSEHGPHLDDWRHALAVARVINGTTP